MSPVKSLGRWYDSSLKDTSQAQEVTQCLQNGIQAIDTKRLQEKFKAWIAEHVLVPKIMWSFKFMTSPCLQWRK